MSEAGDAKSGMVTDIPPQANPASLVKVYPAHARLVRFWFHTRLRQKDSRTRVKRNYLVWIPKDLTQE